MNEVCYGCEVKFRLDWHWCHVHGGTEYGYAVASAWNASWSHVQNGAWPVTGVFPLVATETRKKIECKLTDVTTNGIYHGCRVASDRNASWNGIWRHGQGGEACERSLDFPVVNETRDVHRVEIERGVGWHDGLRCVRVFRLLGTLERNMPVVLKFRSVRNVTGFLFCIHGQ